VELSETDDFIIETVKHCVWSGFYNFDDIQAVIDDIIDDDANEILVRSSVAKELAKKAEAQKTWPEETDCDRLDQAFENLNKSGVIALHNTGQTISDGLDDVAEALGQCDGAEANGYCFYHGQDLERALEGGGLWLTFGDFDDDAAARKRIGESIKLCLEKHAFFVEWDGSADERICLPEFDWKRRYAVCSSV
jgi:hypothetical protein